MKIEQQVIGWHMALSLRNFGILQLSTFAWDFIGDDMFVTARTSKGKPSAFTLAELGLMFPHNQQNLFTERYDFASEDWFCAYQRLLPDSRTMYENVHTTFGDTEIDARAEMIEYLLINNMADVDLINKRLKYVHEKG